MSDVTREEFDKLRAEVAQLRTEMRDLLCQATDFDLLVRSGFNLIGDVANSPALKMVIEQLGQVLDMQSRDYLTRLYPPEDEAAREGARTASIMRVIGYAKKIGTKLLGSERAEELVEKMKASIEDPPALSPSSLRYVKKGGKGDAN